MKTYLQHGTGTHGPFCTEEVANKTTQIAQAAFRHGSGPQPTSLKVLFCGAWRRVYAHWDSRFFIRYDGGEIALTTYPDA